MDTFDDDRFSDDLAEITGELRARRYDPGALRLDELKRRALSQASATDPHGRGMRLRSRTVSLLLVLGLALSGGTAGVMAAGKVTSAAKPPVGSTPAKSQYKCNAGNGNGSEQPATPSSPDCDPGNSAGNNNDNDKEGPPGTKPPRP